MKTKVLGLRCFRELMICNWIVSIKCFKLDSKSSQVSSSATQQNRFNLINQLCHLSWIIKEKIRKGFLGYRLEIDSW